ncbi:MAG: FAD-binding oxidoreductase [Proteobacteria bacterium]|nr:FAD-binding oxidoreductase [Pseudomonadota bacterium]
MKTFDFVVIGAGIAGASAACELAPHGRVALLEREDTPGYHTTGRSAALFTATYGNAVIRGLTVGSRAFFDSPPDGFTEHPLLTPRGAIFIGREDQRRALDEGLADSKALTPSVEPLDQKDILARVPVLDPAYVAGGVHEPECMDMDVHAIHQGFLKLGRSRGVALATNAEVTSLSHKAGAWWVTTQAGVFAAPVVINAAGAGGRIEWVEWDGTPKWSFDYGVSAVAPDNLNRLQHHDVEVLPNGNILMIAWEYKTSAEAIQAGRDPANLGTEL